MGACSKDEVFLQPNESILLGKVQRFPKALKTFDHFVVPDPGCVSPNKNNVVTLKFGEMYNHSRGLLLFCIGLSY